MPPKARAQSAKGAAAGAVTRGTSATAGADAIIGYHATDVGAARSSKAAAPDASKIQVARAWDAAFGPTKALPMSAIMLYMSGNSVQLFSMMSIYMMLSNTVQGLVNVDAVFAPYRSTRHSLAPQITFYVVCQLAAIGIALYKCWSMGLFPTEPSDWLAWHSVLPSHELSAALAP